MGAMSDQTQNPGPTDPEYDRQNTEADRPGDDLADANPEGVAMGAGEPSTFEPEEDPETVPDDPA